MADARNDKSDKFSDLINDERRERELLIPGKNPPAANFSADRSIRGLSETYIDLIPESQQVVSVRIAWQELWGKMVRYMSEDDLKLIGETFTYAANAHANQFRHSGEPYIVHALGAAVALADMQLDMTTLQAALLHDVVEDTDISADEIEEKFGSDVRTLVEGVTKLARLPFKNVIDYQSENLRKMFLVMAKDIRVVLIKLADRMHNMDTIQAHKREKQILIAQETLDIYAPLAHRLGIYNIKRELEDASFRVLNPEAYYEIRRRVRKKMPESEEVIKQGIEILEERLKADGLTCQINGRPKHYYSIYEKMNRKSLSLDQIYDLLAMRVIVETLSECYHTLGIVHSVWKPIPGQFDDYIANPKDNMYQSLHTTVVGPTGVPLEIQIRTREMHSIAEYGIAAHWQYKEQKHSAKEMDIKLSWIRNAIEEQRDSSEPSDFLEHIKTDVLTTEVFLFTPQGKVISLPKGSTPIDFAYTVHTQVGHKCVGAMVNGRIVPMDYELKNGEIVRILTSPQGKPSRDWLKIVKSNRTRNKIRAYFRQIDTADREEKVKRGRELIEHEIARRYTSGEQSFENFSSLFGHVANDLGYNSVDEMLAAVGNSRHTPGAIINRASAFKPKGEQRLLPIKPAKPTKEEQAIIVEGASGLLVTLAICCCPIPGDRIVGKVTQSRGITIHRFDCPNPKQSNADRQVAVTWGNRSGIRYTTRLRVEGSDRSSIFGDIGQAITLTDGHILNIRGGVVDSARTRFMIDLQVLDIEHLYRIIAKINTMSGIIEVTRG